MALALSETDRSFAPVIHALRDRIIEHYHQHGEELDTPAGLLTLDTNSVLTPRRAALLLGVLARAGGPEELDGLRVADLGCGLGAMSLYLAYRGATVVGIDPNEPRLEVGRRVAEDLGLPATFQRGWADDLVLPDESFDVAVFNNSLCYIAERPDRRRALGHARRVLVPGGWVTMRNPNRLAPTDPFTGLPLVHHLPPRAALYLTRHRRPRRSNVRLVSSLGARVELRRAGFRRVSAERVDEPWWRPARYSHHAAQRPAAT
jgi:SAM-dependent methyltransferase